MLKSCVFVGNVATLAKQICLWVSEGLAWMYGCYHGDRLVVRSLGEGCGVGMCQTDRGARTHARTHTQHSKLKTCCFTKEHRLHYSDHLQIPAIFRWSGRKEVPFFFFLHSQPNHWIQERLVEWGDHQSGKFILEKKIYLSIRENIWSTYEMNIKIKGHQNNAIIQRKVTP